MTNQIFHSASSRGLANHGWLKSYHTFSFANYHNAERIHFGALRVLNDDEVDAGMGFGTHAHDNMEIISIPLEGDLEHKDSMGNVTVIKNGDIQIMSAGSGITHSEYNKNKDSKVKFLQIWIIPNQRNVAPRYDQITLDENDRHNKLQQILSPNANDEGVWIHQNAWFHLAKFDKDFSKEYKLKSKGNGLYIFNLTGDIKVNEQAMSTRDGFGVWDIDAVKISAETDAEFLLMEVPMSLQ
jgi:quercetin 2,3-dioxygenase